MLSIIITAVIALIIGYAVGSAKSSNLITWQGEFWSLVAGSINSRCNHALTLGQGQINGIRVRGCYHCYNVYMSTKDAAKVQYEG